MKCVLVCCVLERGAIVILLAQYKYYEYIHRKKVSALLFEVSLKLFRKYQPAGVDTPCCGEEPISRCRQALVTVPSALLMQRFKYCKLICQCTIMKNCFGIDSNVT
ncbi:hypothetical protein D918_04051 [Trichuris suis]|nr:hypothetical protein D918_04051 [Trichuris suis]